MREAIDYNALSWIRQEVGVTLKQSRLELEEYAEGEQRKELLQGCAAHLHEARGPLQMVNIKGADMLACEMEEAIADLLLETVVDKETLLEQLMQGFLELPEYLSNLRSGRKDNPRLLFPLINSLRASRGLQPLNEDEVFTPDLSARMPASEFGGRAKLGQRDMTTLARAARVRFQGGLLEWYRDSSTNYGLQTLVEVLEHLQGTAGGEHAARLWWVGAGVAEVLRDGAIETNPTVKRLFGQLDRQIKRVMDSGEAVFDDVLSEDLVKNLLFQLIGFDTDSQRITSIRATYGITAQDTGTTDAIADASDLGDELLQTVSLTARDDVERIKDQLDSMTRKSEGGMAALVTVADGLHSLGNTLGMIGMEKLGAQLADREEQLRDLVATDAGHGDMDFTDLANTLVTVEDALSDIAAHSGNSDVNSDHGNAVLRQGQQAVVNAVIADIAAAKEAINEFLKSSDEFGLLEPVPVLLNKICGGLELVDEERLAVASRQISDFITTELLKNHRQLSEDELDSLADAICSIEYCVEELGENHRYGERAIGVAVESLEKLGYADAGMCAPVPNAATDTDPAINELAKTVCEAVAQPEHHVEPLIAAVQQPELSSEQARAGEIHDTAESQMVAPGVAAEPEPASTGKAEMVSEAVVEPVAAEVRQAAAEEIPTIAELQVIAPHADSEIVEIFIEEAGEVLDALAVDIPAWIANPDDRGLLGEIRRAFHTIKGSGRMVGAMAAGELAWAFENLVNRVIENTVPASPAVLDLLGQAMPALRDLVAQVSNPDTILLTDMSVLGSRAVHLSKPGAHDDEPGHLAEAVVGQWAQDAGTGTPDAAIMSVQGHTDDGVPADLAGMVAEPESPAAAEEEYDPAAISVIELTDVDDAVSLAGEETLLDDVEMHEAVGPVVHDVSMHAGEDATAAGCDADLPVLKQDADPEIVEIFIEEASGVLASISLNIPEWIQQPENTELLDEIRRSLHTLKGSGRMAGAMLMGEFAWSIEALLNKLVEGAISSGGSLFALLSQVPQAASGLLLQLQDGGEPDMDISGMMQKAADLASASPAASDDHTAEDERDAVVMVDDEMSASEDDDIVLMELFSTECSEHLGTLAASTSSTGESGMVSDALYRALHTLTGISESANVPGIGRLAAALYNYFGELYQEGRPAMPDAFALLDDCVREMSSQHQHLPDRNYDDDVVNDLLGRIAVLPAAIVDTQEEETWIAEGSAAPEAITEDAEAAFDEIPELPAAAMPAYDVQAVGSPGFEGQEIIDQVHANQSVTEKSAEPSIAEPGVDGPVQGEGDIYSGMDQELYEIFVEEATEIIDSSESSLRNWSESPEDRELMAEFQRLLHTLKGGARMVDVNAIGDLSHALESLLTHVVDGTVAANDDLFALLQESHDRLAEMLEKVKSRDVIEAATDLESRLAGFKRGETGVAETEDHSPEQVAGAEPTGTASQYSTPESADEYQHAAEHGEDDDYEPAVVDNTPYSGFDAVESDTGLMAQALAAHPQPVERRKEGRSRSELVRVQSDVLDNLVNNAGEINIYRSRMEQQITNFSFNLTEFDQTISRLRDQLRQLEMETEAQILFRYELEAESRNQEFDPLEMDRYSKLQQLSRSLIESISDLRSLHELMDITTRDSETLLLQQSRVSTDLQEGLIRTRMIPFAGLAPRLRRIVRQSARQLDKKVDLHLRGAEGEMDRAVIERIVAPLEHMLRNSVAHGIETPEQRKNAGKRVSGAITIDFNREGTEIVLRISDDGAGLDIDAIRNRAIERGLMGADMDLPDSDVMQFVLQTGFSTASEVTQISGRGVGMDVVNSEVKQLGGSLHIDSVSGKGSVFTIRLPYTLAINQALLITIGEQIFCVPMGSIEGVVTASSEQLQSCYEDTTQEFGYAGHNYQLMHLGSLLGISRMDLENAGTQIPVLLVRTGDKRIGMQVDSLLGSREVVIKPLGAQLSLVDGVSGATILGDGRVVMILDMFAISRMKVREQSQMRPAGSLEDAPRLISGESTCSDSEYIKAIVKLEDRLLIYLDLEKIIETSKLPTA